MNSKNNEKLLIEKIKKGDENAFEIVFLKYYTPLCKYICKYVQSTDLAEEIGQEVFVTIWEKRTDLDISGHLRGLLYEVARNKALDYIKHQKIVNKYIAEAKEKRKKKYVDFHLKETVNQEFIEAADKAIDNLPPQGRKIFQLNREEGLTYKEISSYLDISIKTVESHMRRVLQTLRERLSKYITLFFVFLLQILF